MLKDIKRVFRPPPAEILAAEELQEARRDLLRAQSSREYFAQMEVYHEQRILRLTQMLSDYKEGGKE